MSKQLFDSLMKRTYPKGIGFAFSYRTATAPIEEQRKKVGIFFKHLHSLTHDPHEVKLYELFPIKYEVELGFMISKAGRNIPKEDAMYHIGGYFLTIDFTSSELFEARKRSESWCLYKNGENFMPVSPFIEPSKIKDPNNLDLELRVNGETKQKANTSQLVLNIAELISLSSKYTTLNEGDLFLTGTPAGADIVKQDDRIYASLTQGEEVLGELNFKIKLEHK